MATLLALLTGTAFVVFGALLVLLALPDRRRPHRVPRVVRVANVARVRTPVEAVA